MTKARDLASNSTGSKPTLVDAKGDLLVGTAADTAGRLVVGNNGETLVADSSATTGLRWQGDYAAGKNKIINGDFGIWQRGTSISSLNSTYGPDRFIFSVSTAVPTWTVSQQTFTAGTAPVSGYEGTYFCRAAVTSQGSSTAQYMQQRIEDVRVFAGQTITFSFWAKAASTITINDCKIGQNFGSGGSSAIETAVLLNSTSVGTSWARYTGTVTLPSVSGKTIGSSSYLYVYLQFNSSNGNYTFDTWGWQLEAGSVATAFQTATGTLAGELAACQRYYTRFISDGLAEACKTVVGLSVSTSTARIVIPTFVPMRVKPTAIDYNNFRADTGANQYTVTALSINDASTTSVEISASITSGPAAGTAIRLIPTSGSTTTYLGFSAEL